MKHPITISDYCSDWFIKDKYVDPKPKNGSMTREEVLKAYSKLEIDAVELGHTYWDDYKKEDLKKLCDGIGLKVYSYNFFADLAVPKENRPNAVDAVKKLLDRAVYLGVKCVLTFPAVVKKGVPLETQKQWLIDGLRESAEYAKKIGIKLCIENLDDPICRALIGSCRQIKEVYEKVDSDGFGLIYDDGATPFVEEDPIEGLKTVAPYMFHMHIKNCRQLKPGEKVDRCRESDTKKIYTGTLLENGQINIPKIIKQIAKIKYTGYISVEYQGMEDPIVSLKKNIEYFRKLENEFCIDKEF